MSAYPGAAIPHVPFKQPIPVPSADVTDAPTVCISVNVEWLGIILGLVNTLTAQSTWSSDDPAEVDRACNNGFELLRQLANPELCPVPIEFQVDPDDDRHWEYSLDGGITWLDGPLTNVSAPDDAIITDPTSLLRNTIDLAATGADGLVIKALAQIGVQLQKGGIAAFFQKIPGLGLAADTVIQIAGGDTYDNPIIETTLP